jgi:hypothetical protein
MFCTTAVLVRTLSGLRAFDLAGTRKYSWGDSINVLLRVWRSRPLLEHARFERAAMSLLKHASEPTWRTMHATIRARHLAFVSMFEETVLESCPLHVTKLVYVSLPGRIDRRWFELARLSF